MRNQSKRGLCFLLAVCLVLGGLSGGALAASSALESMPQSRPFADVRFRDWFFPAVEFVHGHGIMTGTTATIFAPEANFSRAMVVTTLFRIYNGRPADGGDARETHFLDVEAGEWYAPYIAWAYQNGVAEGDGTRFMPQNPVDRQQFATMLHRFADRMTDRDTSVRQGAQWNAFTDRNEIQSWALDALIWANYHGLITGRTATTIVPAGTATRAEAATILARFLGASLERQRINIAELLDRDFRTIRYGIGDVTGNPPGVRENFQFDTGILIGIDREGRVASIQVDYARDFSTLFYYNQIDNRSTRADVERLLGAPTLWDGISYTYWLSGEIGVGIVLSFTFNSLDHQRVDTIKFAHAVLYMEW